MSYCRDSTALITTAIALESPFTALFVCCFAIAWSLVIFRRLPPSTTMIDVFSSL